MTLATRCPACGTIFRVVQDQLRVSQGWVRCGRCSEAFNAIESMVELPPPRVAPPATAAAPVTAGEPVPPPPQPSPPADPPPPAEPPSAQAAVAMIEVPAGMALIASDGAVAAELSRPLVEGPATAPRVPPAPADESPAPAAAVAAEPAPHETQASDHPVQAPAPMVADVAAPDVPAPAVAPSFVVRAERAARWRRPHVRLALWLGVLLATGVLLAQATYHFRDRVAATVPALRPWLVQACQVLSCRVGDYRQIDALSVESTGLVRVEGSPVYRLSVTLRNRAALEVAAPAIDLVLNDAQGQPIARRVLQMADLDLPLRTLKPGVELPIQVPLGIGDRQVAGYTVEIFYP